MDTEKKKERKKEKERETETERVRLNEIRLLGVGVVILPPRSIDNLETTLAPGMRNLLLSFLSGEYKRLPKQYRLFLLSLVSSQKLKVRPHY